MPIQQSGGCSKRVLQFLDHSRLKVFAFRGKIVSRLVNVNCYSDWTPPSMAYCGNCSAYLPEVSLRALQALTWNVKLATYQSTSKWMRLFNTDRELFQIIYDFGVIPSSNTTPIRCNSYGRDSIKACFFRRMVKQMLIVNGISSADDNSSRTARISSESHHETIELILLFLHGIGEGIVRPLPALRGLGKHRFLNGRFEHCERHGQTVCGKHEDEDCAEDLGWWFRDRVAINLLADLHESGYE